MALLSGMKLCLLLWVLGLALYSDLREQKIRNRHTLSAAAGGLVLNYLEQGQTGAVMALEGWLVPILVLFIFFYLRVLGAGDIKLFAAIGAIMGLSFVGVSFLFSVYLGGIIAVVLMLSRHNLGQRFRYLGNYLLLVFSTRQILVYQRGPEASAQFSFAAAIVPGVVLQLGWILFGKGLS